MQKDGTPKKEHGVGSFAATPGGGHPSPSGSRSLTLRETPVVCSHPPGPASPRSHPPPPLSDRPEHSFLRRLCRRGGYKKRRQRPSTPVIGALPILTLGFIASAASRAHRFHATPSSRHPTIFPSPPAPPHQEPMGSLGGLVARALLPLALLLAVVTSTSAVSFEQSADAFFAFGCDWPSAGDIGDARTTGEACSQACGRFVGCTHFTWTPSSGGTCFFKSSRLFRFEAFPISTPGAVCGFLRGRPAWAKGTRPFRT